MQRLRGERGVSSIVVVLVATAIFGVGAVVVDAAALFQERRVLQNGADAAALAVAEQCAAGACGDPAATAKQYADGNADDGTTTVEELCGSGVTGAGACSSPPTVPGGAGYAGVTTSTDTSGGNDQVGFTFGKLIGFTGLTVRARAYAAWGGPSSTESSLAVTISLCEYDSWTNGGADLAPPPPYSTSGYPTPEAVLYLHNTSPAGSCEEGPAGSDLPGGFGWLETTSSDCSVATNLEDWFPDDPGRSPPASCSVSVMADLVGTVIHLPTYEATNDLTGQNGEYRMKGFVAFYLTGYSITGQFKVPSLVTGNYPCSGDDTCLSGFFVDDPTPVPDPIGGPSMGVVAVNLIR
jgi:hypothetical protein